MPWPSEHTAIHIKNGSPPDSGSAPFIQALDLKRYEDARFTIDTLNNYLVSAAPKVTKQHIPFQASAFYERLKSPIPDFIALANQLGRRMCDKTEDQVGMVHDGYLKLYQLSNPVLDFDCILLDEAQGYQSRHQRHRALPGPDTTITTPVRPSSWLVTGTSISIVSAGPGTS